FQFEGQQCQLHILRMFRVASQDLPVLLHPLLNQSDLQDSQSQCRLHSSNRSHKLRRRRNHHRCRHCRRT
ncbi:hypothetical protein HN51_063203, partial [Arachis hypogaea]